VSAKHCCICGSAEHTRRRCSTRDRDLGVEIRADEAAATKELTKLLSSRVRRTRWLQTLLTVYRSAVAAETGADAAELKDLMTSMDQQQPEGKRHA
jgi:hypothetical protein